MRNFDTLRGGSRARLAKYRREHEASLATIRARRTADEAARFIENTGYTSALNHRGDWIGGGNHGLAWSLEHARKREKRIDHVAAPWAMVDGWRDTGDAHELVSLRHTGWYADEDGFTLYIGHVWQLPARDGTAQYVAGYVEQDSGLPKSIDARRATGYVVLEHDGRGLVTYDDKEDAARAADGLAESNAEDAREYSERWNAASIADNEREDARQALSDARTEAGNVLHAWRAQQSAGPLAPEVCQVLRGKLEDARDDMRRALRDIASAAEKIADAGMQGEF